MRILFCNIAQMKYYKGIIPGIDEPRYGGAWVDRTGDAYEKYNFDPIKTDRGEYCFGFFETKSTNRSTSNQLHIERLEGVSAKAETAEHVLVIWCSTHHQNEPVVVGWYRDAAVYRQYQEIDVDFADGTQEVQTYNIKAPTEGCVLLPDGERNRHCWWAPRKKKTGSFGFGQANVWFAEEESAENYIRQLMEQIEHYTGENWLREYPPEE